MTLPVRDRGLGKNRIEALIDGIFAVAMTLLVLEIKLPEGPMFDSNSGLWAYIVSLERHFAIYAISFVVLGMYWTAHHLQFHFVRYADRGLLWLNLVFLLLISFVPFATDVVGDHGHLILPCIIYGVALFLLAVVSWLHLNHLAGRRYLATADLTPAAVRMMRDRIAASAVVPLVAVALAFYSPRQSLYVYLLLAVVNITPGGLDHLIHHSPAPSEPADPHGPA